VRNSGTYLFDDTLPCADGVPIVELLLRKVELGYFCPVLNLIHRSFKLGMADDHGRQSIRARRIREGDNRVL